MSREKEDWEIWEEKAIPALTKILEQNKDKIDGLEYRKFLGPTGDVPATVENTVKRQKDGSYKIESVHPVGIKRYVSTYPLYSEKGYTLGELVSEMVKDISNNDFRDEFVQNLEKRTGVNLDGKVSDYDFQKSREELTLNNKKKVEILREDLVDKSGKTYGCEVEVLKHIPYKKRDYVEDQVRKIIESQEGFKPWKVDFRSKDIQYKEYPHLIKLIGAGLTFPLILLGDILFNVLFREIKVDKRLKHNH